MKYVFLSILILCTEISFGQATDYKETTLKDAFAQVSAGIPNDTCSIQWVRIEISFSGNVQRVLPKRGQKLSEVFQHCGFDSKQDWTRATELSVFEDEIRYWVQLEPAVADEILSKYRMGDILVMNGRLIAENPDIATSFLIVEKLTLRDGNDR